MKKIVMMVAVATMLISCGTTKTAVQAPQSAGSPFGNVYEMPAAEYDTDDYFGATGIAQGPATRMDVLQMAALTNAQNIVRQKIQHAYKGAIRDYSNYIGTNAGADAETKMERGGTQLIDAIVNDTKATKIVFSSVDEKGNVTCFTGIRVNKKAVSDVLAKQVADNVSDEEELKIRFKEEQFSKHIEESFKNFKENNNQ